MKKTGLLPATYERELLEYIRRTDVGLKSQDLIILKSYALARKCGAATMAFEGGMKGGKWYFSS